MATLPPRVAICTHNTDLGRQVATGLSGHPFEIASHSFFEDFAHNASVRKPDVIGLILPKDAREAVAKVRVNYPETPIVLVTESGEEIAANTPRWWSTRSVLCFWKWMEPARSCLTPISEPFGFFPDHAPKGEIPSSIGSSRRTGIFFFLR